MGFEWLATALVEALADLAVIETTNTATIEMKSGGEFSYKYADIADVVKVSRPMLAKYGLVALTPVHAHGDGLACTVIILHTSGERLDLGPFPFPHGRDARATGSMVTYHRRYALIAALGMAAGGDDDGATAAPAPREALPKPLDMKRLRAAAEKHKVDLSDVEAHAALGPLETLNETHVPILVESMKALAK